VVNSPKWIDKEEEGESICRVDRSEDMGGGGAVKSCFCLMDSFLEEKGSTTNGIDKDYKN